jgi:hypothetical protein
MHNAWANNKTLTRTSVQAMAQRTNVAHMISHEPNHVPGGEPPHEYHSTIDITPQRCYCQHHWHLSTPALSKTLNY